LIRIGRVSMGGNTGNRARGGQAERDSPGRFAGKLLAGSERFVLRRAEIYAKPSFPKVMAKCT
jgi:hypothetical protein